MKTFSSKYNFSEACEAALNKQINIELTASYTYMTMGTFCSRDGVALPGLSAYCAQMSIEEREHSLKLQNYVNKRGGLVTYDPIIPSKKSSTWESALDVVESMLELEKGVNNSLLELHKLSDSKVDPHLSDFLESEFLTEQVDSIKELVDMLTQLMRVGPDGLGLYIWDQNLLSKVKNSS